MRIRFQLSIPAIALLSTVVPLAVAQGPSQCEPFAPPAVIQGKKIYNSVSGSYLPIKGINYYPRPNAGPLKQTNSIDFFTDEYSHIWERDIEYFKQLNVNVIRIYAVAPGISHDAFMCALKAAGIYVIVGLAADCLNCAITKDAAPACYPVELKNRGQFIIAEFARYDNVLAFSAGNEVSLSAGSSTINGSCQKQFIRDMRAFINKCSATVRRIPIGLAIADVNRAEKVLWYSCRSDPDDELENADFIGLNTYTHCDGSAGPDDPLVGYEMLIDDFETFEVQVPVILTEFGCLSPSFAGGQRNFLQVDTLFSSRFREQFAGGVVFEYNTELVYSPQSPYPFGEYGPGNFGVGYFSPESCDDVETNCAYVPFPQFNTLSQKYLSVDTSDELLLSQADGSSIPPPICPSQFTPLSSIDWPSATAEDRQCPGPVYVSCPAVPEECTGLGVPYQGVVQTETSSPNTSAPSAPQTAPPSLPPMASQSVAANLGTEPTSQPTLGMESTGNPVVAPTIHPATALTAGTTPSPSSTPTMLSGASLHGLTWLFIWSLGLFLSL